MPLETLDDNLPASPRVGIPNSKKAPTSIRITINNNNNDALLASTKLKAPMMETQGDGNGLLTPPATQENNMRLMLSPPPETQLEEERRSKALLSSATRRRSRDTQSIPPGSPSVPPSHQRQFSSSPGIQERIGRSPTHKRKSSEASLTSPDKAPRASVINSSSKVRVKSRRPSGRRSPSPTPSRSQSRSRTPIVEYSPPREEFTPPKTIWSPRPTVKTKAAPKRKSPLAKVHVKEERRASLPPPDIDHIAPLLPPSPSEDPLLLKGKKKARHPLAVSITAASPMKGGGTAPRSERPFSLFAQPTPTTTRSPSKTMTQSPFKRKLSFAELDNLGSEDEASKIENPAWMSSPIAHAHAETHLAGGAEEMTDYFPVEAGNDLDFTGGGGFGSDDDIGIDQNESELQDPQGIQHNDMLQGEEDAYMDFTVPLASSPAMSPVLPDEESHGTSTPIKGRRRPGSPHPLKRLSQQEEHEEAETFRSRSQSVDSDEEESAEEMDDHAEVNEETDDEEEGGWQDTVSGNGSARRRTLSEMSALLDERRRSLTPAPASAPSPEPQPQPEVPKHDVESVTTPASPQPQRRRTLSEMSNLLDQRRASSPVASKATKDVSPDSSREEVTNEEDDQLPTPPDTSLESIADDVDTSICSTTDDVVPIRDVEDTLPSAKETRKETVPIEPMYVKETIWTRAASASPVRPRQPQCLTIDSLSPIPTTIESPRSTFSLLNSAIDSGNLSSPKPTLSLHISPPPVASPKRAEFSLVRPVSSTPKLDKKAAATSSPALVKRVPFLNLDTIPSPKATLIGKSFERKPVPSKLAQSNVAEEVHEIEVDVAASADESPEDDEGGAIEVETEGLVKISSLDPWAAARAAAILKQHHDYEEEVHRSRQHAKRHTSASPLHKPKTNKLVRVGGVAKSPRPRSMLDGVRSPALLRSLLQEAEKTIATDSPRSRADSFSDRGRSHSPAPSFTSLTVPDIAAYAPVPGVWTKSDWKALDRCFSDERVARGWNGTMAPAESVRLEDVVDRFTREIGPAIESFGDEWAREKLLRRTIALRDRQLAGRGAPPTPTAHRRQTSTMQPPWYTPTVTPSRRGPNRGYDSDMMSTPVTPAVLNWNRQIPETPTTSTPTFPASLHGSRFSHLQDQADLSPGSPLTCFNVQRLQAPILNVVPPSSPPPPPSSITTSPAKTSRTVSVSPPRSVSSVTSTPSRVLTYVGSLFSKRTPAPMNEMSTVPMKQVRPMMDGVAPRALPFPPEGAVAFPRGPVDTPARPPIEKSISPKDMVDLDHVEPPIEGSRIPVFKRPDTPKRMVDLAHIPLPPTTLPKVKRKVSTGSVRDIVKAFEDKDRVVAKEKGKEKQRGLRETKSLTGLSSSYGMPRDKGKGKERERTVSIIERPRWRL